MAAALAAEKFFEAIKADIAAADKYVVGVIQHDETQTGIDRAGGFIDKFQELVDADDTTKGKVTIEKEVKPGDADNAYKTALEALYEKSCSAIFMSNEGVVKQVYDANWLKWSACSIQAVNMTASNSADMMQVLSRLNG